MSVIATAGWIEQHRRIVATLQAGTEVPVEAIVPALRAGWDYVGDEEPLPTALLGIPRFPHIAIIGNVPASRMPGRPMFAIDMTAQEVESGLYRHCCIRPEAIADGTSIAADPYAILPDVDYDPGRAWLFRAITGHAPRDVALFLADQIEHRPNIGKLLLGKDYRTAMILAPDLVSATWPDTVRVGWRENGGKDYLPPLQACALHAELARLSMNDLGMILLAFDHDGNAITTQGMIRDLVPDAGEIGCAKVMAQAGTSQALTAMVPFQTYSLLPPTEVFEQRDARRGHAWSRQCASLIPTIYADYGATIIDKLMSFTGHLTPAALQSNVAAHPKAWPEPRQGYGCSAQKRPAVEYWGLDRRQNAAVGLLEIAAEAQAWNRSYRNAGGNLRTDVSEQLLANAMQTILCLWLEDAHSPAACRLDQEIREGFRDRKTRQSNIFADDTLDDICRMPGFGSGLLRTARRLIAMRAKPGQEGYSARYKAHFWLTAMGDDLSCYLDLQRRAVAEHYSREDLTGGLSPQRQDDRFARYRHHRPASMPLGMTSDPEAAACARDIAMMIASSGLDPMRSYIARPARNVAVESM